MFQKIKEENEKLLKEYGFCIMDNHRERIANFKIEPPGLFRGRGNHPKMGMLKRRIMPEDIIINCSKWVQLIVWARNKVGGYLCSWEYCCWEYFPGYTRLFGNNAVFPCIDLQVFFSYWLVMRKFGNTCSADLPFSVTKGETVPHFSFQCPPALLFPQRCQGSFSSYRT